MLIGAAAAALIRHPRGEDGLHAGSQPRLAPKRIKRWPPARLQPYATNAKLHGPDQVAKLTASLAEFGWTVPRLVADDGELIAGHGRVLAATQLGLTEAPAALLGHLADRASSWATELPRLAWPDPVRHGPTGKCRLHPVGRKTPCARRYRFCVGGDRHANEAMVAVIAARPFRPPSPSLLR